MYAGCLEINDLLDVDAVVSQIEAGYAQESTECKESNTSEEKELVKNLQSKLYQTIYDNRYKFYHLTVIIFDNFPFNATKIFRSTTYFSSLVD